MKRIDSFRNTFQSQSTNLSQSVLKKSTLSAANLYNTTQNSSQYKKKEKAFADGSQAQVCMRQPAGARIQTKVIGYASNHDSQYPFQNNQNFTVLKSQQSYGVGSSKNNTLALPTSRSGSHSKGSDVGSRKSRATGGKAASHAHSNGHMYLQKFKKYKPCVATQYNSKTKEDPRAAAKENEYQDGAEYAYADHCKSQEKKYSSSNSIQLAFKQRLGPQTQQPSINVSNSSSHNLLPGLRGNGQRYHHNSSQSSTIKNFKSMNNTDSVEQDRRGSRKESQAKRAGGGEVQLAIDATSSSQQRMSNEDFPNRPKTTMNAGGRKVITGNEFAFGSADSRPDGGELGWNSHRQMIIPNSRTKGQKKNIVIETSGSDLPHVRSEESSVSSKRREPGFKANSGGGGRRRYAGNGSRRRSYGRGQSNNYQRAVGGAGQAMYDSIPRDQVQAAHGKHFEGMPPMHNGSGRNQNRTGSQHSTKVKARIQKNLREIEKEGTVSSESRGDSFNRPNINARLQRTSDLTYQNDQMNTCNNRQQQSYEYYLKQKEEVAVSSGQRGPQTTLRSVTSYDPSAQIQETELTTKVLGVGGAQQMVRVGQIPKFERSPQNKNIIQANELPRSIVCFQGMPKNLNAYASYQVPSLIELSRFQNHTIDDFQTPRSRMEVATGRNQNNTQRQGSQRPPNSMLEFIKDSHRSIISSLFGEKLSNRGAKASTCRSQDRVETVSLQNCTPSKMKIEAAGAPNGGGATAISNKRRSLPYLVHSKSVQNTQRTQSSNESQSRHSSQVSHLSLHSHRRRKAQNAWNKGMQSGVSSNQQRAPRNTAASAREHDPTGNPGDDLNLKLIHANSLNDHKRSAQNHLSKLRTTKVQGILKIFGVQSTNSSNGQLPPRNNEVPETQDNGQSVEKLACFGRESNNHQQQSVISISDNNRKDATSCGRPSLTVNHMMLPQDVTFFLNTQQQAIQKQELITFQKLDQKRAADSVISSIVSPPQYSAQRTPVLSNLASPRPVPSYNPIATQDSPLACPALLNSSIRSPDGSLHHALGHVYLALYDRHISSTLFSSTFADLISCRTGQTGAVNDNNLLVPIPGLRLCFDTALSDCPFVQEVQDEEQEQQEVLQVRMQKVSFGKLVEILKRKATEGEPGPMVEGRVVEMLNPKSSDVYVQWEIGYEGKADIIKYIDDKDNGRLVEEDDSNKLEQIIRKHIRYLHYNCAKQMPFTYENLPVFIITNDQTRLPLTLKKSKETTLQTSSEPTGGPLQASILTDDSVDDFKQSLDLINRYHLFSRIKDRAGAPTRKKLAEVRTNHQNSLQLILEGLLECAITSQGKRLTWHQAFDYISQCQGAQVNFDQWKLKHKEAKMYKGPYYSAEENGQPTILETQPDQMIVRAKATSEKKDSLNAGSSHAAVLAQSQTKQVHLQTEQARIKVNNRPSTTPNNLTGSHANLESAQSRIDFTLTSNTNGTQTNNQAKEDVVHEDAAYMPQTILDQSQHQSELGKLGSRNECVQKILTINSKKMSSTQNIYASETTSRNAHGEVNSQDEIATLRAVKCAPKKIDGGPVQNNTGTRSRSSVRGQEMRHQIINNHLLATTSQSNLSFEEKNFQNQPSPSELDLRTTLNPDAQQRLQKSGNESIPCDEVQITEEDHLKLSQSKENDQARLRHSESQQETGQDLHDLSKSLVNSLMLNEKNLRTIIQDRINSINHRNAASTDDRGANSKASGGHDAKNAGHRLVNSRGGKNAGSYVDTQTVVSSEKFFVLNRFNDLQFMKQSSGSFGGDADPLKAEESPIVQMTGGASSVDGKHHNEEGLLLADLFLDKLIQMTQENKKNQDSQFRSGTSDILFQQLGSIIEFNQSLNKNERQTDLSRQIKRDQQSQCASIPPNPLVDPKADSTDHFDARRKTFDKLATCNPLDPQTVQQLSTTPINKDPLPFPTESLTSSLSLRRDTMAAGDGSGQKDEHVDDNVGNRQPPPILIKDLSDITPRSEGKKRMSNDLMAVLESVLRKSKICGPAESLNLAAPSDDDKDAKQQYEMVFSGLEELLAGLKIEYRQRFKQKSNGQQLLGSNARREPTNESSTSEIDQQDFDENVRAKDSRDRRQNGKSPQKVKGIREQLAEYGSIQSVKVVDVSTSDINEQFLSNVALLRRISTVKNPQNIQKSQQGLPEVQIFSDVETKNEVLNDSIEKSQVKEAASTSARKGEPLAASAGMLRSSKQSAQATLKTNPEKLSLKDHQQILKNLKTLQSCRYSNQAPDARLLSEMSSIPLAKIDLTLDNINHKESKGGSFIQQQQTRKSGTLAHSKFRRPRDGTGAISRTPADKENQL